MAAKTGSKRSDEMQITSALIKQCVMLDMPEVEYALRYIGDRQKATGAMCSDDRDRREALKMAMVGKAEIIGWTLVADEIRAI